MGSQDQNKTPQFKLPALNDDDYREETKRKGKRPIFFPFPKDLKTTLSCKECGGIFFNTERFTSDWQYDEVICQGCGRTKFVYMRIKGNQSV